MVRLILTTFSSEHDAARIVRTLVEEKLAACGTILPGAHSIYFWDGKLEQNQETCVLLKTSLERSTELATRLQTLHPYETPEIITLDPTAVSGEYERWVMKNCLP